MISTTQRKQAPKTRGTTRPQNGPTVGKENKEIAEIRSYKYLNTSLSAQINNSRKKDMARRTQLQLESSPFQEGYKYERDSYDSEHSLNVRYVSDIDSIVPPRYNPNTRTYFKCSIYSPSNRLYTVNEEVNSTQSDLGAAEQFSSSSLLNSGLRKSNQHNKKFAHILRNSGTIIPFPERIVEDFGTGRTQQIDEEDENDDDTGNVSETLLEGSSSTMTLMQNLRS